MKQELQLLVNTLMEENSDRSKKMNDPKCSAYSHTTLVHEYNNTLDIIKRIETIIKKFTYEN